MKCLNVNKLTKAGCTFKFWVADWCAGATESSTCLHTPTRHRRVSAHVHETPLLPARSRFALMNNKMGGDLKKIQTVGQYMVEARHPLQYPLPAQTLCANLPELPAGCHCL